MYYEQSPLDDAQDYLRAYDKAPLDYTCKLCGCGFDSGFGVKIDDEHFCKDCDYMKQFEYLGRKDYIKKYQDIEIL